MISRRRLFTLQADRPIRMIEKEKKGDPRSSAVQSLLGTRRYERRARRRQIEGIAIADGKPLAQFRNVTRTSLSARRRYRGRPRMIRRLQTARFAEHKFAETHTHTEHTRHVCARATELRRPGDNSAFLEVKGNWIAGKSVLSVTRFSDSRSTNELRVRNRNETSSLPIGVARPSSGRRYARHAIPTVSPPGTPFAAAHLATYFRRPSNLLCRHPPPSLALLSCFKFNLPLLYPRFSGNFIPYRPALVLLNPRRVRVHCPPLYLTTVVNIGQQRLHRFYDASVSTWRSSDELTNGFRYHVGHFRSTELGNTSSLRKDNKEAPKESVEVTRFYF